MKEAAATGTKSGAAAQRELDRVGAFSDGVFAVAITLLVLNIEVPAVGPGETLAGALDDLFPAVQAYFIAFAVIGLFWYGHHISWSRFHSTTRRLVWANLLMLSLVALMPFTTALMGKYDDEPIAVALYAFNVGLAALADALVDRIAFNERLVAAPTVDKLRAQTIGGWLRPAVFFASIPLAWISVLVAQLSWLTLFLLPALSRRLAARPATRSGP